MIVHLVLFIDDSNGQGYEEEGVYYEEEEEENFNHLSNQGKLTLATLIRQVTHASLILANPMWQANTCYL